MDPILEQKVQELYQKLTKARAAGAQISEEQIESWLRRETNGKYGVSDAQQYVSSLSNVDAKNIFGSLGQGASFNFADEAAGLFSPKAESAMRLRDKAFSSRHPLTSFGLKLAGGLSGPLLAALLAPEGAVGGTATGGAMLTRAALLGAAGAGTAAAGASEKPDLPGRVTDAALPAAAGLVLGPVAALGTKAVGALAGGVRQAMTESADAAAVRNAGRLMPPDLTALAARQEALAPGSFVPAAASPEATAIASGVGASSRAALPALEEAQARLDQIIAAKRTLGSAYDALGKKTGPLKIDNDLRDILHSVGEDTHGQSIGFDRLQKLRTEYREKASSATRSAEQNLYNDFKDRLTAWLEPKVSGLEEVDSRYSDLSRMHENAEQLVKTISESNKNHGKNALYGAESGSIAGHLPASVRGFASSAVNALKTGKDARAEGIYNTLMQPADATMIARLAASREFAMQPRVPTPGSNFVAPLGGSNAIETFFQMLAQPLPDQMRPQDGGQ